MNHEAIIHRLSELAILNEHIKLSVLDSYVHLFDHKHNSLPHRTIRTGLFFLLKGNSHLTCYEQTIDLQAGDMMFYPINLLLQGMLPPEQAPILFLSITVNIELLIKLASKLELKPQKGVSGRLVACPMSPTVWDALLRIFALLDNPNEQAILLEGREIELYYALLQSPLGASLQALIRPDSALNKIRLATQFITENFNQKIAIDDLAMRVGMSNASLYQHFKQFTQLTPIQYQKTIRLNEAKRLIKASQHSLTQIAFDVGYESPNQFSREYKRLFGISPNAERVRLTQNIV